MCCWIFFACLSCVCMLLCGCYSDTYHLHIVVDHIHPIIENIFPEGCRLFQQDNALCHNANGSGMVWGARQRVSCLVLDSKFPRSQSNWASVGCAGQTSQIYGGPTSQLTGLKGSAANILVPDTTAHLQGSGGVHGFRAGLAAKEGPCFFFVFFYQNKRVSQDHFVLCSLARK